jgi:hypothetical protein
MPGKQQIGEKFLGTVHVKRRTVAIQLDMESRRLTDNLTPMVVQALPMEDRHGREVLVTIAKLTYAVSPQGVVTIPLDPAPLRFGDEPVSMDPWSSVRFPSDAVEHKPGTDLLLVGTAQPPPGPPVSEFDVTFRVESPHHPVRKTLRIHGPRIFTQRVLGIGPGRPSTARPTPLRWEQTFGGRDTNTAGEVIVDPRNPSGFGFALDKARLLGTPVPEIEDPRSPMMPAGFGPIAPSWSPRLERAGTHDEAWARERAPLRPRDYDPRHASVAPADQWSEGPLEGDEAVEVLNATASGVWRFRLPRWSPRFEAVVRGVAQQLHTHLDTFLVDADAGRVELVWRASVPLPRKSEHLEVVRVTGAQPLADPILADLMARSRERDNLEAP